MIQIPITDMLTDPNISADITATWVETWLHDISRRIGKVWPLQTVNACNPLAAYEHLPFQVALEHAAQELDFSIERSLEIFQRLYQERVFTLQDINAVLAADEQRWLNQTLDFMSKTVTYRELLACELRILLANQSAATEKAELAYDSQPARQFLENAISSWYQDHSPSINLNSNPGISIHPTHMIWINEQATKWLAAYMDEGQTAWSMPGQQLPFRKAWSDLVLLDGQVPNGMKKSLEELVSRWVQPSLPAIEAIAELATEQQLNVVQLEQWIDSHLRQLPGWAGYIHYCQSQGSHDSTLLADYLLMRLIYHLAGLTVDWGPVETSPSDADVSPAVSALVNRLQALRDSDLFNAASEAVFMDMLIENLPAWMAYCSTVTPAQQLTYLMAALEKAQQAPLVEQLSQAFSNTEASSLRKRMPDAQAVFCIDVRSEPYRKQLETIGAIETYGFAGFFGLPIAKVSYGGDEPVALCPILLQPKYHVHEGPSSASKRSALENWLGQGLQFRHQWLYAMKKIKREPFTTFSYVEGFGLVHAFTLLKDSFASLFLGRLHQSIRNKLVSFLRLQPQLHLGVRDLKGVQSGIPLPDQIELARNSLKMMGLHQPYAEFVIVCGHEAQAYNNAYASSLDCGACGANGGGFNALVMCQILNQPEIRDALSGEGIDIPDHTRFIAAVHNTTTDTVRFLNEEILSSEQQARFGQVQAIFEEATIRNRHTRQQRLKEHAGVSQPANLVSVSYDWSQTRPEWGLSKNHAFIIGNREATQSLDLEGRCFLHSYDWETDQDASILTMIMTAPLVVGAWINLQYDFSTLDAQRFGSGPKYLHNPVGLFGTYLGNSSDLQIGLPYESLFANDGSPYHYPQRLLVFINAPLSRVQDIIQSQPKLRHLVQNEWIHLTVFDPTDKTPYKFAQGRWQSMGEVESYSS